jgi:cytochrome c556
MPEGMQAIGTRMHRAASQFSLVVNDTSVTGDVKPALAALANLTEQCVACHAGYRLHP